VDKRVSDKRSVSASRSSDRADSDRAIGGFSFSGFLLDHGDGSSAGGPMNPNVPRGVIWVSGPIRRRCDAVSDFGSAAAGVPGLQPSDLSVGWRLKVEGRQGVGANEAVGVVEAVGLLEEFDR
jgi:hypothetical protein